MRKAGALDELSVQAELGHGTVAELDALPSGEGEARRAALVRRTEEALKRALHIRVAVELLKPGTLPETTFKARRVVDERPRS
ncbi:hypothetical protein ACVGVM_29655 (plasmid) [Pseudonocardia bannensis]|uniref:hypothetical protein n=1 Tax=Pseudonocardia TaxID=1847 RepID=UPI0027E26326|nr:MULTISPECIES: hypothetical protein [Pseudonocardia]